MSEPLDISSATTSAAPDLLKNLTILIAVINSSNSHWNTLDLWKKSNILPFHKKGDKKLLQNYRSVSLLPILLKILDKILFNSIFEYLQENNLLCENQSDF